MAGGAAHLSVLLGLTLLQLAGGSTTSSPTLTREEEVIQNEATVVFYLLPKSTFAEKRDTFRQTMAEAANNHCKTNHVTCGLPEGWENTQTFTMTDVEISSDSDSVESSRLHVKYTVSLPRSLTGTVTNYILNKDAVYGSVTRARMEFYKAIGYSVEKAGTIKLSPVPDLTVNAVMITIGLLVVLASVGILLGCHFYRKQESKNKSRKEQIDDYIRKHPKQPERDRRVKAETAPPVQSYYTTEVPQPEPDRHYHPDRTERHPPPMREPEPSYTKTRNHQYSPDYSESRQPFDNYNNYEKDYREPYREPYSQPPRVQTMTVSSYNQPPNDPNRDYRDRYHDPNDRLDRTNSLEPLTPEELRRQRKKEKKAKKRQRKADDEAAARYAMAGAPPAVGYENGSYDNSERYPVAPSGGQPLNIPVTPVRPQEEEPRSDHRFKDTGSEGSDSGLNSTVASRSVGSGYYRSTEV